MNQQALQQLQQDPELKKKADDMVRSVLARSVTDAEYRQRLLTNPREAIPEVTGHPLPPDYQVAFVESKADFTVVLPKLAGKAVELNEVDLATVSGGTDATAVAASLGVIVSITWAYQSVNDYVYRHTAQEPQVITDDYSSDDWMSPTIPTY